MAKSNPDYDAALEKVVSKRYTLSRLKRILLQNFLNLSRKDVKSYLESPLYCKVLAVARKDLSEILASLKRGSFPVLMRKSDAESLKKDALACFEKDVLSNELYNILTGVHTNEYESVIV